MAFFSRFFRFLRSSFVGILATVADFGVLEVCVRLLHVDPATAKIFSFLVGLAVQFFGNRTFAFHATGGSLRRQVLLFCAVESITLTLNWLFFRFLVRSLHLPIEVANLIVTFVIYVGFSYPAWRIVFRSHEPAPRPAPGTSSDAPAGGPEDGPGASSRAR